MGVGARSKIDSVEQGRGGNFDGPGISSFRDRLAEYPVLGTD